MDKSDPIGAAFAEARATLEAFLDDPTHLESVRAFAAEIAACLGRGGRLLAAGNGGSMCDAMHFVEEWTGRFRGDRTALPALSMGDPSQLTCIANDFGFDEIFARQVEANGREGDLFLAISTSGDSPNLVRAVQVAREAGLRTVGLLGKGGGQLGPMVDVAVVVPRATTSDRIQELHIKVIHSVIEAVERQLFPANYAD
jgi:D-sedoheptulose 7-phosphate isomerase